MKILKIKLIVRLLKIGLLRINIVLIMVVKVVSMIGLVCIVVD